MSENEAVGSSGGLVPVTEGDWVGWSVWQGDAFEQRAGPFYERREEDGTMVSAFQAEDRHMNGAGFMHGGCLMAFADSAIFTIATDELAGSHGVTMHLAGDCLHPARVGQLIEARGVNFLKSRSPSKSVPGAPNGTPAPPNTGDPPPR